MEQNQANGNATDGTQDIVHVDASFEPLIPKFMANRKKETVAMRQALDALDFETIRTIAHGIKGAGGSYGFDRVTEFGAAIERAAKAADADTIGRELPLLTAYLDRITVVYD